MPTGATCRRSRPGVATRPPRGPSRPGGSCLACALVVAVTLGCGAPAARLAGAVRVGGAAAVAARAVTQRPSTTSRTRAVAAPEYAERWDWNVLHRNVHRHEKP